MITTAVFDVGETLVDETRAWSEQVQAAGVTPLTLFGAFGALIERGAHHRSVWELKLELDQTWDLLHQRRGLREAGQNPDDAREPGSGTVEGYIQ